MSTNPRDVERAADLREAAALLRKEMGEILRVMEAKAAALEARADKLDAAPGIPSPVESILAVHELYNLFIGQGFSDEFVFDRLVREGLAVRRLERAPAITEHGRRELMRALWAYELDVRTRKYDPSTGCWLMSEATQIAVQASARTARPSSGSGPGVDK